MALQHNRPVEAADQSTAEFVPERVLVRFSALTPDFLKESARQQVNGELLQAYQIVPGLELLRLPPGGMSVPEAIARLEGLPYVAYAEPDYIVHADLTPNDPSYPNLWGMPNIRAPQAWDTFTGSSNMVVAIIDTGIDYNHPDLAANMWKNPGEVAGDGIDNDNNGYIDDIYGYDFVNGDNNPMDGNSHGTHTAGTVGAVGNNGVGVAGVNWNVKLMALKFLSDGGSGSTSNAVLAVEYAANKGVKVSNNSWGGGSFSQSLYDAINNAKSVGHLFIAAAGNNGTNNDTSAFYPANYNLDNIISVAAIDSNDSKASFSNYGKTTVDLGAPGVDIYSTVPGGYGNKSGTSMAAPHVAGAAGLVYGLNPGFTYQQARDAILNNVRLVSSMTNITVTGGVLDAAAALGSAPPPGPTPTPTATPTPAPSSSMHLGNLTGASSSLTTSFWRATVTITVHNASHQAVSNATVSGSWSGGTTGSASCVTNSSGQCSILRNLSKSRVSSVTFTVNNITHSSMTYSPSSNDVGASVTINKP
jgi:subtilisin family serine protease